MGDKYLDNFRSLKSKEKKRKLKKGQSCANLDTFDIKAARDLILKLKERELTDKEKRKVMRIAKKMMGARKKELGECWGYYVLLGAEYAEKMGRGGDDYIKKKLLYSYRQNPEMFDSKRVEDFFIRNRSAATKVKKITKQVIPRINYLFVISFIYLVLGILFLSSRLTGYSIGVGSNYSGILGGILFVFGIFGFFITLRKKT